MADLTTIFHPLQRQLFPALEAELGTRSALDQQFGEVISLTELGRFTRAYEWCGNGAPPCPRVWLAQMTAQRVTALYDLRDSASDAPQMHAFCAQWGHVPIIDPNPRRGEKIPLATAAAQRFKERSAAGRVNSLVKKRYGGRWARPRGCAT